MAQNLIYNPSFEVDLANTGVETNITGGSATITRTSAESYIGSNSCAFYIPSSINSDNWRAKVRFNTTNGAPIEDGKRYVVSLYAKASAAHNTFSAEFVNAGSYYPGNKSLTTSWARYDWVFTASATGNLEIRFLGNNGDEVTIWIDAIMCEQLDSGGPSTYFDGDTAGHEWVGTAHNSISQTIAGVTGLRLKTVRFASPVLTTLTNNTLTNIPQFTVYLPEGTKTIRKAWVEVSMDDAITATGGTVTTKTVNLRLGAAGYTSTTNTQTLTNTGENASFQFTRDFTSHFTTNWSGTSMTCDIQVQTNHSSGTTTGMRNVCAILYVTYEYDDVATTQIKTVLIPLNAPTTFLPTTKTSHDTIPALDTYLPEASKVYRNIAVVFESNTMSNSTTDFSVSFELGASGGVHTTQLYEGALNSDRFVRYVWDLTSYTFAKDATHTFNMWSSLTGSMDAPIAYLIVTYEYNASTTTSVMNSLQLPMEIDSPNGTSSTDFQRSTREVWVQEASPVLQRLSFQMYWQGVTNESGLNARIGTGAFVGYTITGSGLICGNKCLMVRNDAPTGLTFGRGRNLLSFDSYNTSASERSGNLGGYWLINYTSNKAINGTGAHNHTVLWPMYTMDTGGVIQGKYTTADSPNIPETDYFVTALGFDMGIIIRSTAQGIGLKTERLVAEGGLIWERIYADISQHDNEMGYYDSWIQARTMFERWQGDEDTSRLPLETNRRYYMNTSNASSMFDRLVMYLTYHSILYEIAGTVSGSNGGTVTIGLHRVSNGEKVKSTSRTGNGAYSFTWYDDTEAMYTVARETDTYVGRSGNGNAS